VRAPAGAAAIFLGLVLIGTAFPAAAMEGPYAANATRIAVKLSERLSSQEAHVGETFDFETTSSVAVEGFFLPAGTRGRGVVVAARPARGPRSGELRLAARTLDIAGGAPLAVGLEPGPLDRTLRRDARGFDVPLAGAAIYVGRDRSTNVVFERGTPFIVIAPPPPDGEATPAAAEPP